MQRGQLPYYNSITHIFDFVNTFLIFLSFIFLIAPNFRKKLCKTTNKAREKSQKINKLKKYKFFSKTLAIEKRM
jgi:hypothetical protein